MGSEMKIEDENLEEFLKESNAIEGEYSKEALQDAKQAWMCGAIMLTIGAEPLSIDLILAIHRRLMKRLNPTIAGKIRDVPVYIGGEIRNQSKEEIKKQLQELVNYWNNNKEILRNKRKQDIEYFIKRWHILFELCHGFCDGNGRTGRILLNLQRIHFGLPLLIIHHGLEQQNYYLWFKRKKSYLWEYEKDNILLEYKNGKKSIKEIEHSEKQKRNKLGEFV
jgi:fido (protein-threonine AMPylation protein)